MKRSLLIQVLFITFAANSFSQTKIIAFKSHSGSVTDFAAEFQGHFELLVGNLGLGPQQIMPLQTTPQANLPEVGFASSKNKRLDSVKYVNEVLTICYIAQYDKTIKNWKYGVDSIRQNSHFEKENPLSTVKTYLRSNYYFKNAIHTVKFIGFENHSTKNNFINFVPRNSNPPGGNNYFVLFTVISVLSIAAFFSWKTFKSFPAA